MIQVDTLTFNPFQENTYILSDETRQCVIIDPGCLSEAENNQLANFIQQKGYQPVGLWFTHLHLDHVFGSKFAKETYGLQPAAHHGDTPMLAQTRTYAQTFGVQMTHDPAPIELFFQPGQTVAFGHSNLTTIHIPGHSPGSLVYYSEADRFCIAGDVIFHESIGRTDLPGGSYEQLVGGILSELMALPDDTKVYPGHGPATTIGHERAHNPFL